MSLLIPHFLSHHDDVETSSQAESSSYLRIIVEMNVDKGERTMLGDARVIFVTVGSRNYQFDRLFKKLDELYENGTLTEEMFAQTGTSTYKPKHYAYKDFITPEEFVQKIKEADIVVSHGASGSIMKALNAGKKVIAVTRLEKYNEHINDHQIQNNEAFSSNHYVLMADLELDDLGECFNRIYDGTDGLRRWENRDPLAIVNMIDSFIQENWK